MEHNHLGALILTTLGIFIVPFLSPFLKIPVAVGELLYGVFLGFIFSLLGWSKDLEHILGFLSFLGFSLLMFLAGLEIDWNRIETLRRKEKSVIFAVVLTNFIIALLVSHFLHLPLTEVMILGALGIGLMLSVLRELNLDARFSQTILIAGSLGEVATLSLLTFYDLYLSFGLGNSFIFHTLLIGLFALAFMLLLKLIKFLVWLYPQKFAYLVEGENKAAIDIRASFALMLAFMGISTLVHIEPILGAFIAGTLVGFIFRDKHSLESKLTSLGYGFLIPFFFIQVGMQFDITSLGNWTFLKLAMVLLVSLFLVKVFSSLWFLLLGFSFREILLAGALFSFPFTVLIAVGKILFEKGIWQSSDFTVVVILTLLSSLVYPLLAKFLAQKSPSKE